jgi:hypothetical protein
MNKSRLLELIRSERQRLETTLAALSENQMVVPGVVGDWSVKDILAHITVWEQHMIHWLKETLRGEVPETVPYGLAGADVDERNERIYLEHRDRALAEVLADFGRSCSQVLKAVEGVSEEDLIEPHRFERPAGEPLWVVVAANTFEHYEEHNESISAWLEGREGA